MKTSNAIETKNKIQTYFNTQETLASNDKMPVLQKSMVLAIETSSKDRMNIFDVDQKYYQLLKENKLDTRKVLHWLNKVLLQYATNYRLNALNVAKKSYYQKYVPTRVPNIVMQELCEKCKLFKKKNGTVIGPIYWRNLKNGNYGHIPSYILYLRKSKQSIYCRCNLN